MLVDVHIETPLQEKEVPRLGWSTKILYGVGEIPNAVKTITFGLFVLFFYSTVMGVPAALVGIGSAVMSVWDACMDPYIGHLSDNWRSRYGRRHPFMLVGALTMGISYWLLFSPPQHVSHLMILGWLILVLIIYRTSTSLWGVPYSALGAEFSQDYHERTSINAIRGIVAVLGTIATAGLSFILFFPDTGSGTDPKLNYNGYGTMGIVFGGVMTITALLSIFGTIRHRSYATIQTDTSQERPSFMVAAQQSLKNRSFLVFFFAIFLFYLGLIVNTSLSIYFLTYYARITGSASLSFLQSILYIMSCVGVFFWLFLSRYIQKHKIFFIASIGTALLMACAGLFVGEGHIIGTGNTLALAIGQAIAGILTSMIWFIPSSMLADITDEDELVTGKRREGSFFGLYNFAQQLAGAAALLVSGILIDWYAGLQPGQAVQSPLTVQRIGVIYSALPALLLLVSGLLMLRYTMTRGHLEVVQQELVKRRESGLSHP